MSTIFLNSGQQINSDNTITWNNSWGGNQPVVTTSANDLGFIDSGYFYAPYIPMTRTPVVLDPNSFEPRAGLMTRYGKKLIEEGSKFYGKIEIGQYLNAENRVPWQFGWDSSATISFEDIKEKKYDLISNNEPGDSEDVDENVWQEPEEREARRRVKLEAVAATRAPNPVRYVVPYKKGTLPARALHRRDPARREAV
jgi:hypothetical protein